MQANWEQRRATRAAADAAEQAARDQDGAPRQLATSQAWAATHPTEETKQAQRQQHPAASDERDGWLERIRSILRTTQPLTGSVPGAARPARDPAILNTIVEQLERVSMAPIEATDIVINQARQAQTSASLSEDLSRPARTRLGQLELHARSLQPTWEAERMALAAKARENDPLPNETISQAFYPPLLAERVQLSPSRIEDAPSTPRVPSSLAMLTSASEDSSNTTWLEQFLRATSAELVRDQGMRVLQNPDAVNRSLAEYSTSSGIDLRTAVEGRLGPNFTGVFTQEDEARKKATHFDPGNDLFTKGIVDPQQRHGIGDLEDGHRDRLQNQRVGAANERLESRVGFDHALQTGLQKQLSAILRDAATSESVRTIQAGANDESRARKTFAAEAFASSNGVATVRERLAAIEGRQRLDPREVTGRERNRLKAEAERGALEWPPATAIRIPGNPAPSLDGTSPSGLERLMGIGDPTRGAMGDTAGHRIDFDRMARAMEMFTQGLERFLSMGTLPAPVAGRSQMAPLPPALPAKPTPFMSRTDGGVAVY